MNIDEEWCSFVDTDDERDKNTLSMAVLRTSPPQPSTMVSDTTTNEGEEKTTSEATPLFISTQTKIAYLNTNIPLADVFWSIPVQEYGEPKTGFIKKQMKFNSVCEDDIRCIHECMALETQPVQEDVLHKNTKLGTDFKDVRKITVGLSRKDILAYHAKRKSAFYNCFIVILRVLLPQEGGAFREFHVKLFNTGKIEIPGIQNEDMFQTILSELTRLLKPLFPYHKDNPVAFFPHTDTVLINSNFNCGFFIKRDVLFALLRNKYGIQSIFDPCSYPGIQCKFYYNMELEGALQTGVKDNSVGVGEGGRVVEDDASSFLTAQLSPSMPSCMKMVEKQKSKFNQVSFMIFRTGSVLIVGMCDVRIIYTIYAWLKQILQTERELIRQENQGVVMKHKKKKLRRRTVHFCDATTL